MTKKEKLIEKLEELSGKEVDSNLTIAQLESEIEKLENAEVDVDDALLESVDQDAEIEQVEQVEEKVEVAQEVVEEIQEEVVAEQPSPKAPVSDVQKFKSGLEQVNAHLEAQPKVPFYLPLQPHEKMGQAVETVSINGLRYSIPKGEQVVIPQQIAQMLQESMTATHQIIHDNPMRIANDATKIGALS